MAKYKLYGFDIEDLLVIDNTNGISINGASLFNFPNKYKEKIGSSIYSYTTINYLTNNIDLGNYLSPKINVFNTGGSSTITLKPGTRKILCICLGGGAGGTGGNQQDDGESGGGGGGGGGGGLAWILYKVDGGEELTINVGNGGTGGSRNQLVGEIGTKGENSSVKIGVLDICIGYGGEPGVKSTFNNNPGTSGIAVSGTVHENTNTISSGVRFGLVGGNGQYDPDAGNQNAASGNGGAGGNGGTTTYTWGIGTTQISKFDNFKSTQTIGPLQFNNVNFVDTNISIDPLITFSQKDFDGTNTFAQNNVQNYGEGGCGGQGEGRNNGTAQNGFSGKRGFVIIVQYGV